MITVDEMRHWIDNAGYVELLTKWRFAAAGDPFFLGDVGRYYGKVMAKKRSEIGDAEHVKAGKSIGWIKQ